MKKAYFLIKRNNGGAQRPRATNQVNEHCEARRPRATNQVNEHCEARRPRATNQVNLVLLRLCWFRAPQRLPTTFVQVFERLLRLSI